MVGIYCSAHLKFLASPGIGAVKSDGDIIYVVGIRQILFILRKKSCSSLLVTNFFIKRNGMQEGPSGLFVLTPWTAAKAVEYTIMNRASNYGSNGFGMFYHAILSGMRIEIHMGSRIRYRNSRSGGTESTSS